MEEIKRELGLLEASLEAYNFLQETINNNQFDDVYSASSTNSLKLAEYCEFHYVPDGYNFVQYPLEHMLNRQRVLLRKVKIYSLINR